MKEKKPRKAKPTITIPEGWVMVNGKLKNLRDPDLSGHAAEVRQRYDELSRRDGEAWSRMTIERETHYPGGLMVVMVDQVTDVRHHVLATPARNGELGFTARSGHCFECKTRDCAGVDFAVGLLDDRGYKDEEKTSTYIAGIRLRDPLRRENGA